MLIGIIALGTFGFWCFLSIFTILFWSLLENKKHGWATLSMIVAMCLFSFFGNFSLIAYAKSNLLQFSVLVLGYFVAGVCWSIAKWFFYVNSEARKYKGMKEKWCREEGVP